MSFDRTDTDIAPAASRRDFLRKAGLTAIAAPVVVGGLAACTESRAQPAAKGNAATDHSGGTMAGHAPAAPAGPVGANMTLEQKRANADKMDAHHE